ERDDRGLRRGAPRAQLAPRRVARAHRGRARDFPDAPVRTGTPAGLPRHGHRDRVGRPSPAPPVEGECGALFFPPRPAVRPAHTALVVDATNAGIPVRYTPIGDVGADRIVDAVAAWEKFGRASSVPLIVVDFGTATTFNAISAKGEYLGGIICPGINISAEAL